MIREIAESIKYLAPDNGGGEQGGDNGDTEAAALFGEESNSNSSSDQGGGDDNSGAGDGGESGGQGGKGLDDSQIDAIVKATLKATKSQQLDPQQSTVPPLSPEEIKKAFHIYEPSQELIEKIHSGGEAGVEALKEIVQGVTKQTLAIAAYQFQNELSQLRQQLAPAQQYVAQQQEQALRQEFFSNDEYKDLERFEPILIQVKDAMVREGWRGTKEEAFKEVASRARQVISKIPGLQGENGSRQGKGPTGEQNKKMQSVAPGGPGGTGGGGKKDALKTQNSLSGEALAAGIFGN